MRNLSFIDKYLLSFFRFVKGKEGTKKAYFRGRIKTMICKGCDYKKNAPEGICKIKNASDGLPVRCVGLWAKDKYFYLGRYFEIFTAAMRKRFNY